MGAKGNIIGMRAGCENTPNIVEAGLFPVSKNPRKINKSARIVLANGGDLVL